MPYFELIEKNHMVVGKEIINSLIYYKILKPINEIKPEKLFDIFLIANENTGETEGKIDFYILKDKEKIYLTREINEKMEFKLHTIKRDIIKIIKEFLYMNQKSLLKNEEQIFLKEIATKLVEYFVNEINVLSRYKCSDKEYLVRAIENYFVDYVELVIKNSNIEDIGTEFDDLKTFLDDNSIEKLKTILVKFANFLVGENTEIFMESFEESLSSCDFIKSIKELTDRDYCKLTEILNKVVFTKLSEISKIKI